MKAASWSAQGKPVIILIGAAIAAYFNSFFGIFQFDDYNVIVDNPVVHDWQAFVADLPHGIRPLLKFSYTLNWISGLGLSSFHLFNLCMHLTNALLVYWLSYRFLSTHEQPDDTVRKNAALLAALLFALHPVQTEAVTYISGRSASMMAMLYLACLAAYVHGRESGKRLWIYGVSPSLFLLAAATKETAVTLPAALLLWEVAINRKRLALAEIVRWQGVHWILLLFLGMALFLHPGHGYLMLVSFETRGVASNLLSQANGVLYLLSRLLFIHQLNFDPALPVISGWSLPLAINASFLVLLFATGIWQLRQRPWLGFGILWFFLHMLPTSSIVPRLDIANERHLYLANWGIFLALGTVMAGWVRQPAWQGSAARYCSIALLATCMVFTHQRNEVYRSEVAMWEDVVGKSPHNARAYNNLGYAYGLAGRHEEARRAYLAALHLRPDYTKASNNLFALPKTRNAKASRS